MAKGILRYKGTYFSVYEKGGKFLVYEKGFPKTPISTHRLLSAAKNKAANLNRKAQALPWWDRE